ncbi:MAG: 23S rRNA (uracil-C(5))-methyltransferase RlmCD [Syntrophaceae bacterium PtaB.Bin095]|nr:MAG: 23S rRNA (uracil-C(5))-methyltransferase RlmCD [Syntrophaceae bacterium PtaB.Bin095]
MEQQTKTGDVVKVGIERVAFGGEGVGRVGGMVVFVPFTAAGDHVEITVTETKRRYLKGKIRRLSVPSPARQQPLCRYFTACGGCRYQHIRPEEQIRIKQSQVIELFERIGKMPSPPVREIIPSPRPFHYRIKADYHLDLQPGRSPALGFMDVMNRRVIDIDRCEIVDEPINRACQTFRRDLASGRITKPRDRQAVWSADTPGGIPEVITDFRVPRFVTRTVMGHRLRVPYRGFFQANGALLPRLVAAVVEAAGPTGRETIADVHCGSGLFSFFLSPAARTVHGIEVNGEAVHCARWNHREAGLANAIFHRGDAGEVLNTIFVAGKKRIDILILDPPRTGCDPALLAALAELRPARIVYISCNPATQARDIRCLANQGFTLQYLQPFDMFPQTAHIEVVALLNGSHPVSRRENEGRDIF